MRSSNSVISVICDSDFWFIYINNSLERSGPLITDTSQRSVDLIAKH